MYSPYSDLRLLRRDVRPTLRVVVDQMSMRTACVRSSFEVDDRDYDERAHARIRHPAEQRQRAVLVEVLVEVAALRALDAGRAAALARAALEQPHGVGDPALELLEAALGDADAARVPVVDEDGRRAGVRVDVRREAADVPAVAHRPERQQRDHRVLGGVQRREQRRHLLEPVELACARHVPDRLGLERRRRQVERDRRDASPGRGCPSAGSATTCSVTETRPNVELEPAAGARRAAAPRCRSTVSFFTCVYQSPRERLDDGAPRRRGRARGRATARRGGGRPRPRGRSSTRARARRCRAPCRCSRRRR